jgi:hypothetical protein
MTFALHLKVVECDIGACSIHEENDKYIQYLRTWET